MTDDTNLPNTPGNPPGNSGSRWEPDPAAPGAGIPAAPVPPADPAYDEQPAPAAPARTRPSRTRLLTGGLAAAALVVVGGAGVAIGHVTAGGDHRDGVSDVSFQQGDHGLPPGTDGGQLPPPPGLGDDDGPGDGDDDGGLFGDDGSQSGANS
jgi:hypothetical protein